MPSRLSLAVLEPSRYIFIPRVIHTFLHLVPNMSLGVRVFGVRVLCLGTKEITLGILTLQPAQPKGICTAAGTIEKAKQI